MKEMKAVIFLEINNFKIKNVQTPEIFVYDVLIRNKYAGLFKLEEFAEALKLAKSGKFSKIIINCD